MLKFKQSEKGSALSAVLIAVLAVGLIGALVFGFWAFSEMQDYKNNSDKKALAAVAASERALKDKIEKEYAEKEKSPFKTYQGSSNIGGLSFNYPKTWSGYVLEGKTSGQPLQAYFNPGVLPGIAQDSLLALRVDVSSTTYDQEVKKYDTQIKQGKLKATAYMPKNLKEKPNALAGVYFEGEIENKKSGAIFVIKLRDKTLKITTDNKENVPDLVNTVLASLNFTP